MSIGSTLAAALSLCLFAFISLKNSLRDAAFTQLSAEAELYEVSVANALNTLALDAAYLAKTHDMTDALWALTRDFSVEPRRAIQFDAKRKRLEHKFVLFLEGRPYLKQARLIEQSEKAPELVRVSSSGGQANVVGTTGLRNQGTEPFIRAAMGLGDYQWLWSNVTMDDSGSMSGMRPTLRIVYSKPNAFGDKGGFIVLDADYQRLMQRAVGAMHPGAELEIIGSGGDRIVFSDAWPQGRVTAANSAPDVAFVQNVSVRRSIDIGGGRQLDFRLSMPEATLMKEADFKLSAFLALSAVLVALTALVAAFLGNRLAGHLSDLAAEVSRPRPDLQPIALSGKGIREVQVLAQSFRVVFNRLAERSREMAWHASHDQLSGLKNRRGLDEAIEDAFKFERSRVAVVQFDLDRFKLVNDTLGRDAGDAVIAEVGARARALCTGTEILARTGSDEFMLVTKAVGQEALEAFASKAIPVLAAPVSFGDRACRFGTSMGAVEGPVSLLKSGELFRRADYALNQAKSKGRGRFCYFGDEMERRLDDRANIAADLEMAIERNEISVVYMPKARTTDMTLAGFEALVRWNHPERGSLRPDIFLPIADELKLTAAIDEIVLKLVLEDRAKWLADVPDVPQVSVNVSSRRLLEPGLVASVRELNIPAGAISFELLESIFLDDASDVMTWSCDALRDMGISIELDDFGSGHASILGVKRIQPDRIKLDRALIQHIDREAEDFAVVRAILEMAQAFNVETVAEGVETSAQSERLIALGCDVLQGYFIGAPCSSDEAFEMLRAGRSAPIAKSA